MMTRRHPLVLCTLLLLCVGCLRAGAQSTAAAPFHAPAQTDRLAASPDLAPEIPLAAGLPAWAMPVYQLAQPVDYDATLHLTFVLRRAPEVEAALDQLLADQQTPASPLYHHWLTPEQVGALYGPTQHDLDTVVAWATAQGLTLTAIQPNRILLDFTAPLGTVAAAFHTTFAHFSVGSATRLSIISAPLIPQALSPVVANIAGLVETHAEPQSRMSFQTLPASPSAGAHPQATSSNGSTHYLSSGDFDIIYDLNSVQSTGNTGAMIGSTPQRVAVLGRSRVTSSDITNFEQIMNLPSKLPNVVLAGNDPGISADADEQTLDVQRVIGTAPGAQVDLVIAASTNYNDGLNIALAYNVNTLHDPVMSISYGSCEANDGANATANFNAIFQTAAAEGITTLVSSGDSGAAGCDTAFTKAPSSQAASINAMCASPYVTCVGGTEFNDTVSPTTYWGSTNSSGYVSALSYIPEGAWNEPNATQGYNVAATGGGSSVYIAKPSWQTGAGMPADGRRDVPDVSFAAADHDGYLGCDTSNGAGASCTVTSQGFTVAIFSGTSAAAPGMAGIVALLNTRMGSAQGNINPLLYSLAASAPSAFHDATPATSGVGSACTTSTPSLCNNSTPATSTLTGGLAGYALTTGYDQATGLGSVDVAKLLSAAAGSVVAPTTLTLAQPVPNPATVGQTVTFSATLTPSASSNTPTGTVQFDAGAANGALTVISAAAPITNNVATATYTFNTAGTYTIVALYSGDSNFATSSAHSVSLTVNAPSFTVTPSVTTLSLIAGATTGNTATIAVASPNSFAGSVAVGCAVTNVSGTAAGSCAISPAAVSLTAGSTSQSTLNVTSTPGTAGVLSVVVTGTSGGVTVASSPIIVNLTAPSFTITASPSTATVTSGNTATSTVSVASVNGFAGTVALTCTGSLVSGTTTTPSACTASPASLTLASGGTASATVSIPTSASGSLTATVSGTGTTTGATLASTASTQITVAVNGTTAVGGLNLSASPTTLNFTSGATANNVSTLALTSLNGFAGTVALNCTLTSTAAGYPPTCAISPQTATLVANGTATAVLTISSTTAHLVSGGLQASLARTTATLALLLVLPLVRRRRFRGLLVLAVLCAGIGMLSGCGSGGSSTTVAHTQQSSAGNYTATITASGTPTGSSTTVSATTTVAVTIN